MDADPERLPKGDLFGDEVVRTIPTRTFEQMEREAIADALRQHKTARAAARHLGIARATIHRKMKAYNIRNEGSV